MATENYRILDERDLNELEKEDKSLKEGILKNEKSINDIKEDVGKLQGNVSNMSESIGGIKDDIIGIEDNIADIEGDVDGIKERIDSINDEVDIVVSVGKQIANRIEDSNAKPTVSITPSEDGVKGKLDFTFGIPVGAAGSPGSNGVSVDIEKVEFSGTTDISKLPGQPGATDTYTIYFKKSDGTPYEDSFSIKNGSNGSNGNDGKNAYEVALDNGFQGSEEDWLESLKTPVYSQTINSDDIPFKQIVDPGVNSSETAEGHKISFTISGMDDLKNYLFTSAFLILSSPVACSRRGVIVLPPFTAGLGNFFIEDHTTGITGLNEYFEQSIQIVYKDGDKVNIMVSSLKVSEEKLVLTFPQAFDFTTIVDGNGHPYKTVELTDITKSEIDLTVNYPAYLGYIYPTNFPFQEDLNLGENESVIFNLLILLKPKP